MAKIASRSHLDEDQLLKAVIDEGDLPRELRRHLADCDRCRGEKERFERKLALLGRRAAQLTPAAGPGFVPFRREVTRPFARRPGMWRPLTATAAMAVLLFSVWWGPGIFGPEPETGPGPFHPEPDGSEELIREINALAENPLPSLYLDLLGETDPEAGEAFIRFLVPVFPNEPVPSGISWKGVTTWADTQASPFC